MPAKHRKSSTAISHRHKRCTRSNPYPDLQETTNMDEASNIPETQENSTGDISVGNEHVTHETTTDELPNLNLQLDTSDDNDGIHATEVDNHRDVDTVEGSDNADPDDTCIDLTAEDEVIVCGPIVSGVVDLTSPVHVNDSPIIILGSTSPTHGRTRKRTAATEPIPVPDFDLTTPASASPASASGTSDTVFSPLRGISCPVCFDTAAQIKESGRNIMSTVCGHVFCSECITNSIASVKCCPQCRKKLTIAKVHPLFI